MLRNAHSVPAEKVLQEKVFRFTNDTKKAAEKAWEQWLKTGCRQADESCDD